MSVLHQIVWMKVSHQKVYREVRLLIRRTMDDQNDLKFSISNASDSISVPRLAFMQCQRFWIERTFEDAKGNLGLDEYQLRKWRGWHHHMTMVVLAHLFLLRERIENAVEFPLLSCRDVVELLAFYLPKRDATEAEIFRQLATRHRKRRRDMERKRG